MEIRFRLFYRASIIIFFAMHYFEAILICLHKAFKFDYLAFNWTSIQAIHFQFEIERMNDNENDKKWFCLKQMHIHAGSRYLFSMSFKKCTIVQ